MDELRATAEAAATCTRCDLYRRATQTVFGSGDTRARVMLVGEQPGDREDLEGEPFVGPAGRLLDELLAEAGIEPETTYTTNAVKHFKFEDRGKRRIHKRPSAAEVQACRTWLEQEIDLVAPRVIVCLGVTAARAVLGRPVTISSVRGQVLDGPAGVPVVVTAHPSAVLRTRDRDDRRHVRAGIASDLTTARHAAR
jgi:uracil-DNA glycosylase